MRGVFIGAPPMNHSFSRAPTFSSEHMVMVWYHHWLILSEFVFSDIAALLLEGLLRIVAVNGAGLGALEACGHMLRHMVAYSGAMVQAIAYARSPPMNKSSLSHVGDLAMVAR